MQTTGAQIPANVMSRSGDPVLNGWLQLGYLSYLNRYSLSSMRQSFEEWQFANPEHPANAVLKLVMKSDAAVGIGIGHFG